MPSRRPPVISPAYARLLAALASAELPDCKCPLSMLPVCFLDRAQFCRERLKEGSCACRPRWLPTCLLSQPHGCATWSRGKRCDCELLYMPECFSPGCDRRRRGKLCECPRWPGLPCEHVTAYAAKMRLAAAFLTLQSFCPPGTEAESLWTLLLWQQFKDRFADPPPAGRGKNLIDRETRVKEMELRRLCGVSLWHADDTRAAAHEQGRAQRRRINYNVERFSSLLLPAKGGEHGRCA